MALTRIRFQFHKKSAFFLPSFIHKKKTAARMKFSRPQVFSLIFFVLPHFNELQMAGGRRWRTSAALSLDRFEDLFPGWGAVMAANQRTPFLFPRSNPYFCRFLFFFVAVVSFLLFHPTISLTILCAHRGAGALPLWYWSVAVHQSNLSRPFCRRQRWCHVLFCFLFV